ncbi:MAG TPA: tetratricopeptide repeat protein [Vicinamibacterales bacterium]|nr:tetratricopeptide repeat protein [Vicinamibacterales bacterium]
MPIDRDATIKKAEKLLKEGKLPAAIREYVGLVEDRPEDWASANALGDLYVKAGDADRAVEQFLRAADHLHKEGFYPRASAVYKKVLRIKDGHDHTIWRLADIAERHGLLLDARTYYARLIRDRRSRADERGAVDCLVRLALFEDADAEAMLVAARALIPLGESKKAARLMLSAADDLVKHGRATEALDTLKEAAQMSPDDREIRERLSAVASGEGEPVETPSVGAITLVERDSVEAAPAAPDIAPSPAGADASDEIAAAPPDEDTDIAWTAPEAEPEAPIVPGDAITLSSDAAELSAVLAEIEDLPDPVIEQPRDLESIFEELRAKVARDQDTKARDQYERALRHLDEGKLAEAIANLEESARTPTMRFEAASRLARVLVSRGELAAAVDWLERAVEAPPPTPEEGHAAMYELGDALSRLGETARALAVLMELEGESNGYRDVRTRIAQLSQAQSRGEEM